MNNKKWLIWGLIGFTVILIITAIVLFFQLRQPAPSPAPRPRPTASPQLPPIQETTTEEVCSLSFTVAELKCTGITLEPTGTGIGAGDVRKLTAQVSGDSGSYTHAWTITSAGNDGSLSSTTTNPTTWTAPSTLQSTQEWVIKDTLKDTSTTQQTTTCEVKFNFGGLNACFDTCGSDSDCESDLRCLTVSGTKRCVNPSCTEDADCTCASPGPSPSPSPSPSPQAQASPRASASPLAQAQLPQAGVSAPLVLGVSAGILLMLLGLVF
ncbi:hypothetical protein A3I57_02635 [Candidatus Beckwithbacteria bacterium RIFCSPLOWO2_02_FULL_47_23]|uniref:Uncharacterized protein n=2 Tax=Candidatus Beckwithiibacteriota TaxID=1752726 RepID=A0A1F5DVR5_9BACT|nr:MAG: hypothetical protein A3E73_00375 [Candidatus Beckwithbacteria bacterium RIFCSPHIGHO2_12_FULL_47_17]OGD59258.1 MAG: hypothetical protein A3I57_02635 [Candidatus Beckwithbacteria bacterium RIFCSPLOWO2_02_FULL_47_23]